MKLNVDSDAFIALRDRIRAQGRPPSKRQWYRIQNAADDPTTADVWIYDEISWWGISAQSFVQELQAVAAATINLHLNSPGGDVFDGIAIYNALRYHPAKVVARVEGIAASIASVIAMAGDEVVMAPHATMMIHDPWAMVMGNAADLRKEADVLDQIGENIAGIYREQGGGKLKQWRDRMLEETWLSDQEAVDIGLADRIDTGAEPAKAAFDLSMFRNPPADLIGKGQSDDERPPTKRDAERLLREAGWSRTDAKRAAAVLEGADEDTGERDVSPSEPVVEPEAEAPEDGDPAATHDDDEAEADAIAARAHARGRQLEMYQLTAA